MTRSRTALLALPAVCLIGACTSQMSYSYVGPEHRTTAGDAIDRIVAARCEVQRSCARREAADATVQYCLLDQNHSVTTNFVDNKNCRNGVLEAALDRCVARIKADGCFGEGLETGWSCRSRNLCID